MNYIEVSNLWKSYPGKTVIENVSLKVDRGEFITIVGASGCGKSTFLRMLLGEIKADQGTISLEDAELKPEPSGERGIVFQRYSVFPHLRVLENVALGLEFNGSRWLGRTFGKSRKRNLEVASEMLARVGLSSSQHSFPSELSGGMQQRLALAQTLVTQPRVLLLDEPFGALDPGIRSDMHELIGQLHSDLNLTVFMVTHDMSEGFGLGTRLLVFDKPRVDPHEPDLYGATITFDLPVGEKKPLDPDLVELSSENQKAAVSPHVA